MRRTTFLTVFLLVVLAAAALRLPRLDHRPMHTDEAVQGMIFGQLLERGEYTYDPAHYHGPTLYYLTLPLAWVRAVDRVADVDEAMLRLVPVLFALGLLLLLPAMTDGLGRATVCWAALIAALSPLMVYYSRYYIQEMILAFFGIAVIASGWRYHQTRRRAWALVTGFCVGLMHATKETSIIALGAMALAALFVHRRSYQGATSPPMKQDILWGAFTAVVISFFFYSSFLTHMRGSLDSMLAYAHYLLVAIGGGHEKPWYYYLHLMGWNPRGQGYIWSEAVVLLLAVMGVVTAWQKAGETEMSPKLLRFMSVYTLLSFAVYSLIPYKTPWLALSFWPGTIVMAGYGCTRILRGRGRTVTAIVLVVLLGNLARQAWRGNFVYPADPRNPYVYSHTSPDLVRASARIHELASIHPDRNSMLVKIISEEYWPLPWYLRAMDRVGYWSTPPADVSAPVVITSTRLDDEVRPYLAGAYTPDFIGLRPGVTLVSYVAQPLWNRFMEGRRDQEAKAGPVVSSHRAMGTEFQIMVAGTDEQRARSAAHEAFLLLDLIDEQLSSYKPSSDISRIRKLRSGESTTVGLHTFDCLDLALSLSETTGAAFDPTVGALVNCWHSKDGRVRKPTEQELERANARTGPGLLVLDEKRHTVTVRADQVLVDLGGIGKGYALDRMAELLAEYGITSALLHGGTSSILAMNAPPGEPGWPVGAAGEFGQPALLLKNGSLSASGKAVQGTHVIDPRSGQPVQGRTRAWARASSATVADALATSFMVMREDEVRDYCASHDDVSGMFVEDGSPVTRRFGDWPAE